MSVAKELSIEQFADQTPNTYLGFDNEGNPVLKNDIVNFVGAIYPSTPGTAGLVKAPLASDYFNVLHGSGNWFPIFSGLSNQIPVSNGLGSLSGSNLFAGANSVFLKKNASEEAIYYFGVDGLGGYDEKRIIGKPLRRLINFLWLNSASPASAGSQSLNLWGATTDFVLNIEVKVVGIKSDGTEGYSVLLIGTFRKVGAGDIVQVGTTTKPAEHLDDAVEVPFATLDAAAGFVRLSYDSGSGTDGYIWTAWTSAIITPI